MSLPRGRKVVSSTQNGNINVLLSALQLAAGRLVGSDEDGNKIPRTLERKRRRSTAYRPSFSFGGSRAENVGAEEA